MFPGDVRSHVEDAEVRRHEDLSFSLRSSLSFSCQQSQSVLYIQLSLLRSARALSENWCIVLPWFLIFTFVRCAEVCARAAVLRAATDGRGAGEGLRDVRGGRKAPGRESVPRPRVDGPGRAAGAGSGDIARTRAV